MEIKKLQVSIDKETAFQLMDCRNDNPLYEELENLYEEMKKELKTFIEPKILLGFSDAADIFLTVEGSERYLSITDLA